MSSRTERGRDEKTESDMPTGMVWKAVRIEDGEGHGI